MLKITLKHGSKSITANIPSSQAPAFRSAVEEMRNELGGRASGAHKYPKEDALTRAVAAFGSFAAAVNYIVTEGDPNYA
jgi:hypothetical protein